RADPSTLNSVTGAPCHPERSEGPGWRGGAKKRTYRAAHPHRSLATLGMTSTLETSVFVLADRHWTVDRREVHGGRAGAELDAARIFVVPRSLRFAACLRATAHRTVSVGFDDHTGAERRRDVQRHRTVLRARV